MASNGLDPTKPLFGAAADLRDGFHQFTDRCLGSLFGLDFPELAEVYGTLTVWDPDTKQLAPVSGDILVFPL